MKNELDKLIKLGYYLQINLNGLEKAYDASRTKF